MSFLVVFSGRPDPVSAYDAPSPQELFQAGPKAPASPRAPATPTAPFFSGPPRTHFVRRGDTLYSLSKRHHVSLEALLAANGMYSPADLKAGATLLIPAAAAPSDRDPGGAPATRPSNAKALSAQIDHSRPENKTGMLQDGRTVSDLPAGESRSGYKLNNRLLLEPEFQNPGYGVIGDAASEELEGYGAGLKAGFHPKPDTSFVGILGWSADFSAKSNTDSLRGPDIDASITGLGAGVGMRHSF